MDITRHTDIRSDLLAKVESFIAERGMSATKFGREAVQDGKFVARLRQGAGITLRTICRAQSFIDQQTGNPVAITVDRIKEMAR